ncbi:hypothetical protein [Streptomyces sp. NPDC056821]|uniref:hypothetical protein n=1 Tax=unclassified Streptomyces TaxID=2593676 RepID=UPI0036969909
MIKLSLWRSAWARRGSSDAVVVPAWRRAVLWRTSTGTPQGGLAEAAASGDRTGHRTARGGLPWIRARFGYTAPIGTTDDGRFRRLTVPASAGAVCQLVTIGSSTVMVPTGRETSDLVLQEMSLALQLCPTGSLLPLPLPLPVSAPELAASSVPLPVASEPLSMPWSLPAADEPDGVADEEPCAAQVSVAASAGRRHSRPTRLQHH